jgi:site-specific DNA-methyltransferase (adenine-specific)
MLIAGYETHPAADLFPLLDGDALKALVESIRRHGFDPQKPVILLDGKILDGRNRARAAEIAGVTPAVAHLASEADPYLESWKHNGARRDIEADRKAAIYLKILSESGAWQQMQATIRERANAARADKAREQHAVSVPRLGETVFGEASRDASPKQQPVKKTAADLANAAGVSQATVERVQALQKRAPERFEAVARGEAKANRELAEVKRTEARREIEAKATQYAPGALVDIRHADCLDMIASLADGSVSLLLTDPPYNVTDNEWDTFKSPAEFWAFMRRWLTALRPKMAPDFTAFVFCDADATDELARALRETGWPVLRQAIWNRRNLAKKRSGSLTFLSSYEPFWHCGTRGLIFPDVWGEERFDVQTFAAPQSTHVEDRAVHPTQKPLALFRRLVELGAYRGELVVDPFCGAGTTALACHDLGRRCVTSDTSAEYVRIAQGRIAGGTRAA